MVQVAVETIREFHAHIYFDAEEADRAGVLADQISSLFGVAVGRRHLKPVGPHPRGSRQLTLPRDKFGDVTLWLALNRAGLTIFAHACTGDDLADHTEHVIWLGPSEALHLGVFEARRAVTPAAP